MSSAAKSIWGNDKIQYLSQQNLVITAKNNLNMVMGRQPGEALEIVPKFR